MSVKRTRVRRLANGNVAVTLEISIRGWSALESAANAGGYFGAADYLAGLIYMQIINDEAELGFWTDPPQGDDKDPDPNGDGIPF